MIKTYMGGSNSVIELRVLCKAWFMVTLLVLVCADCDAAAAPWPLLSGASVRTELAEVLS